jgi:hypothetical protein
LLDTPGAALVFGAGLLLEARELHKRGWTVDALETEESVRRRPELYESFAAVEGCRVVTDLGHCRRQYDRIVVTHVLEFIQQRGKRERLLADLGERLRPDGRLLISLRGWSDVCRAKRTTPEGDGVTTGLGTWTRGYTVQEAEDMVRRAGLEVALRPSPKSQTPEQVRLVCSRPTK